MSKAKLVLVDGNSVAYRAFYAFGKNIDNFVNHTGLHTNAIYTFKMMFESIIKTEKPTHMVVAFDAGKTTFRHEFFAEYKAGRAKTPSEFREQIPYIKELINDFGIKYIDKATYEADDLIGTLAKQASHDSCEVVVYSGDRDLTQLTSDNVTVKVTVKGVSQLEIYTPEYVQEKYGLTSKQIIDLKGLAGDKSDNIPGVTKIGEKTAIKLLTTYTSIENLYEHIDELKASKMKENLINEREQAYLSKKLATIDCDVPLEVKWQDYICQQPDFDALHKLYTELDFKKFLSELSTDVDVVEQSELPSVEYQVVEDLLPQMLSDEVILYLETLDDNYHLADIVGLAWQIDNTIYIAKDVYTILSNSDFQSMLSNAHIITFDSKKVQVLIDKLDIELSKQTDDAMIGAYLLNTVKTITEVADIANYFDENLVETDEIIYGKGKKKQVPDDEVFYLHLARKVNALYRLMPKIKKDLQDNEQIHLYSDIELPLAFILAKMEITGITVDANILKQQGHELEKRITILEKEIYTEAGVEFNINSPKQLGEVLFEKMNLPVIKKTKTGYSTSVEVLEKLRQEAPIVDNILLYRQLTKLNSNFVVGLLKQIHSDHKVHTRYQQTLTQTGRLSSVDPNLQNIPIRLEEGRNIRKAFVPMHNDWLIFSSDYSQIELRVLAAISGDENLTQAFKNNQDIHDSTARSIFNLKDDEKVTPNMRRQAKAVNFGVVYGISDYGLSENLGITRKEAKEFINAYLNRYPGVQKYMDQVVREAKDKGYVETLFKRRRYLPEINARNYTARSFAERTAINSPIQGSAADILKIAMIEMTKRLQESDIQAHLLLQVHDEVIFEVAQEDVEKLKELVGNVMTHAVKLAVPLVTDSACGKSWYDAK